jgi:hypothetical protein
MLGTVGWSLRLPTYRASSEHPTLQNPGSTQVGERKGPDAADHSHCAVRLSGFPTTKEIEVWRAVAGLGEGNLPALPRPFLQPRTGQGVQKPSNETTSRYNRLVKSERQREQDTALGIQGQP